MVDEFVKFLRQRASTVCADDYVQPIKDLQSLVGQNDNLRSQFDLAFETGAKLQARSSYPNPSPDPNPDPNPNPDPGPGPKSLTL